MNLAFQNKGREGFTLIEVLIAMAILVFISFSIYQATIESYKLREILTTEGDFYNSIHLATSLMEKDISMLFSPVIMVPNQNQSSTSSPQNNPNPPSSTSNDDSALSYPFWGPALDATGLRPSHFIGSDTKMSFISLSHIRIYRDTPESEFAKVTYELKKDDKNTDYPGTMVLVKTESPNAFATDEFRDTFSRSYEILHGVKKLTYTYLQRDGNTWKTMRSWDSDKEETKNIYPDVIEMKIEVVGPKKQIFEGDYKFRPEIPLNGLNPST